jgi:hypothetical protein
MFKKPTITEKIMLLVNRIRWFGHVQWTEENRTPPKKYYTLIWRQTNSRGRPRNRW